MDREIRRLYARAKPITEMNIFWKTFGNIINNDQELISFVQKHPLLLSVSRNKKRLLEILVDDLGVLNHPQIKTEYLLNVLRTEASRIGSKEKFWKRIGFEVDNQDTDVISRIAKHSLLLRKSEYK
eukprot:295724_1